MSRTSIALALLAAIPLAVILIPNAHATGLVMPALPAPNGTAPADPATLGTLRSLAVEAHLDASGVANVTERRRYALAPGYAGGTATLSFYVSVTTPVAGDAPSITIDGRAVAGTMLAPAEADLVRRRLTLELRDPSPLRQIGTSLYAVDPVTLPVAATGIVEISVSARMSLEAHGTLQGVVLPIDWARPPVDTVTVDVRAESALPLRTLYSPYHELQVVRDGANAAHATYAGSRVCTDFDLTLLTSSGPGLVHLDLLPFRYGDAEAGTFLAFVTADPTPAIDAVLPRDIVLVLDTSGSMTGVKITQAKEALRGVLAGLRPTDRFALISFSDGLKSFQSGGLLPADADNVAAASSFVDGLQAAGGTNIHDALLAARNALIRETGRPRYIVFLTDGVPTAGETRTDMIVALTDTYAVPRIFSFGIGDDVNTVLLDRLARESAGQVLYVRPNQSVTAAVQSFFQLIADPVVANPTLAFGSLAAEDVFPEALPDLFAGRTITLLGRYATPGRSTVTLTGSRGGQTSSVSFDVTMPEHAPSSGYVPRIWALRQVGRLLAEIKQGNADPALVDRALALATRFGVTTNFTTFAVDADGNVTMKYASVPTATTGSMAVDTSSALNGYGNGDAVRTSVDVAVRYFSDRSLLLQGGYLTDTKLAPPGESINLDFGSELYFAFAAAEAAHGAGGLLAAGPNARFELLGRAFRITDPVSPAGGTTAPPESPAITSPTWRPMAAQSTSVVPLGGGGPLPVATDPPRLAERGGSACAVAAKGTRTNPSDGLVFLGVVLILIARRRATNRYYC